MNIFAWIILGALAGWVASMIMGTNRQMGALAIIVVGVFGAFLVGYVFFLIGVSGISGFMLWCLLVAVVGAVLFLWAVNRLGVKRTSRHSG